MSRRKSAQAKPEESVAGSSSATSNQRGKHRDAWIGAIGTVAGAVAGALVAGVIAANSNAPDISPPTPAPAPIVRIDAVEWKSPANYEFVLTGQLQHLADSHRLWAFSGVDGSSGWLFATTEMCEIGADGDFRCEGYAGDKAEFDREFTFTVSIVDTDQADELRDRGLRPFDNARDIPKIAGAWSSHSVTAMRPAPEAQ